MGYDGMVYRLYFNGLTATVFESRQINFTYTRENDYGLCMFDVRCASDPTAPIGLNDTSINDGFVPDLANMRMGSQVEYVCNTGFELNVTGTPSPSAIFTLGVNMTWDAPNPLPPCFSKLKSHNFYRLDVIESDFR